jgi:integrase
MRFVEVIEDFNHGHVSIKWWTENDFFFFPYVYFQFHTGCRPSETAGLTWKDIDLDAGTLRLTDRW